MTPVPHGARCASLAPILAVAGLLATSAAQAALGGSVTALAREHASLRAVTEVTERGLYTEHVARTADGLELHQFVDTSGQVFAVRWQGRSRPDLATLLGADATRYVAAARANRGSHKVVTIHDADLEVTVMKLPRGWLGTSLLPAALPVGVRREELLR